MKDEIIDEFLSLISPFAGNIQNLFLFGSRCRDDWQPDSDYDILIVLEKRDRQIIDGLYDAVMDILISTGRLISLKIFSVTEFAFLKAVRTPFIQNVMKEGVKIGNLG